MDYSGDKNDLNIGNSFMSKVSLKTGTKIDTINNSQQKLSYHKLQQSITNLGSMTTLNDQTIPSESKVGLSKGYLFTESHKNIGKQEAQDVYLGEDKIVHDIVKIAMKKI